MWHCGPCVGWAFVALAAHAVLAGWQPSGQPGAGRRPLGHLSVPLVGVFTCFSFWQKPKANQRAWLPHIATVKSSFCPVQTSKHLRPCFHLCLCHKITHLPLFTQVPVRFFSFLFHQQHISLPPSLSQGLLPGGLPSTSLARRISPTTGELHRWRARFAAVGEPRTSRAISALPAVSELGPPDLGRARSKGRRNLCPCPASGRVQP
jgi:hypothetical protein